MNRKLRMGMVGGGRDAFIGAVHRMAANLDGKIELVAGARSTRKTRHHPKDCIGVSPRMAEYAFGGYGAKAIDEEVSGRKLRPHDYPDVDDGVYGMAFIEACVRSASSREKGTRFPRT